MKTDTQRNLALAKLIALRAELAWCVQVHQNMQMRNAAAMNAEQQVRHDIESRKAELAWQRASEAYVGALDEYLADEPRAVDITAGGTVNVTVLGVPEIKQ